MAAVAMERTHRKALSIDVLRDLDRQARGCLDVHRCNPIFQSITQDGLDSMCIYDAPDAEAMRRAATELDADPAPRIWGATSHFPAGEAENARHQLLQGEATFALVDRSFEDPIGPAAFQAMFDAKFSCMTIHRVRFVGSFLSLDRRRMACIYAAPDLEAVRSAVKISGLPFDSVRAAISHAPVSDRTGQAPG